MEQQIQFDELIQAVNENIQSENVSNEALSDIAIYFKEFINPFLT